MTNNQLLKKTDLEQAELWVRPVRLQDGSGSKMTYSAPNENTTHSNQPPLPSSPQTPPPQTARLQRLVHELAAQLADDKERLLGELQPHLVRLAVAIARRIVGTEIRQNRRVVQQTVRAALDELSYATRLQVRAHPDDEPLVRQILSTDGAITGNFLEMRVVADSRVERGGCVVESDRGIIDASIPTQFVQLQKTLLAYLDE